MITFMVINNSTNKCELVADCFSSFQFYYVFIMRK